MKKGWKIALLTVGLLLGGIGGLVGLVFYATSGVVTAADGFLAKIGTGQLHAAYEETGAAFK